MNAKILTPILLGMAWWLSFPLAWSQLPDGNRLAPTSPVQGEGFGYAVTMDAHRLMVSTRFTQQIYCFEYNGERWNEVGRISGLQKNVHRASAKGLGEVMDLNGNWMLVAAPKANVPGNTKAGMVEVFRYNGNSWEMEAVLNAPELNPNAQFGKALDLGNNQAVIGAPHQNDGIGAAWVYTNLDQGWQALALENPNPKPTFHFGESVAISEEFVAVGVPGFSDRRRTTGGIYIYQREAEGWSMVNNWTGDTEFQSLGQSLAMHGTRLAIGAYDQVVIMERLTDTWEVVSILQNPDAGEAMSFANRISFSPDGQYLLVGASGKAYLYGQFEGQWQLITQLSNDATSFGSSGTLNDQAFVLNSPYEGEEFINGAIYLYDIAAWVSGLAR